MIPDGRVDVLDRFSKWIQSARARRWVPLGLFVAAALLRAILVLSLPVEPLDPDYHEYTVLGRNLVERGNFGFGADWQSDPILAGSRWAYLYSETHALRYGPGYPTVLGLLHATVGPNQRVHQLFMVLVSAVTVVMVYQVGRSLFGPVAGTAAGLLCLISPAEANAVTKMGREPLLSLFVIVGFFLVLRIYRNRRLRDGVFAGLWFGIAAYFKETVAMTGSMMGLWLLWKAAHGQRKLLAPALAMAACATFLIAPWLIRNAIAYDQLVGFTNVSGWNLIEGTVDRGWHEKLTPEERLDFDPFLASDPIDANRALMRMVRAHARERPLQVLSKMAGNVAHLWSPLPGRREVFGLSETLNPVQIVATGLYLMYFGLAFVGFTRFRQRPETHLALIALIGITALHSIIWNYPRYRLPYDNLLFVYAGAAIQLWLASRGPAGEARSGS